MADQQDPNNIEQTRWRISTTAVEGEVVDEPQPAPKIRRSALLGKMVFSYFFEEEWVGLFYYRDADFGESTGIVIM